MKVHIKNVIAMSVAVGICLLGTSTIQANVFTPQTERVSRVDSQPERVDRVSENGSHTFSSAVGQMQRVKLAAAVDPCASYTNIWSGDFNATCRNIAAKAQYVCSLEGSASPSCNADWQIVSALGCPAQQ